MKKSSRSCTPLLLAAALALSLSQAAAAGEEAPPSPRQGWYAGASLGAVFAGGLADRPFTVQPPGFTARAVQGFTLGSGFTGAAQVGYDFDGPRLEGEYLHQTFGRNGTTLTLTPVGGGSTVLSVDGTTFSTNSLFVNGYYDFRRETRWSPYVGAGVGLTWVSTAAVTSGDVVLQAPGVKQSAFAYQAKAGLSYRASEVTDLFLQYRYHGTAGFPYGDAVVQAGAQTYAIPAVDGSLSNSSVELGARFRF